MEFIEILKVIFLGIIEGITEWLPISSTGHMILLDQFISLNVSDLFKEMFFVVIQLGAILAVVTIYFNRLNPFSSDKTDKEKKDTILIWLKILVSCIPAAVIGVIFDDFIEKYLHMPIVIAITLIFYGVLFIIIENINKHKKAQISNINELSFNTAFLIGVAQVLSLIPGTSRSGATILGAMLLGTTRMVATEFTFYLAIPVMFGASFLKIIKFGFIFTKYELLVLIIGMVVAYLVSIIVIKFLIKYIKKNSFKSFGVYRIVLGVIIIIYFLIIK